MINSELLKTLVCPENHAALALADDSLVRRLNEAIANGKLKNKAGSPLAVPLAGGLVRADRAVVYPIVDNIPLMLADEAIPLAQLD